MNRPELLKIIKAEIKNRGYEIESDSVDGKNQSRFIHLVISKDNVKYFAKANLRIAQLYDLRNEGLSEHLPGGKNYSVVKPLEKINLGNNIELFIYPYISHKSISSEASDFADFLVNKTDLNSLFRAANEMIIAVESSSLYSYRDPRSPFLDINKQLVDWLLIIDPGETTAISALQLLGQALSKKIDLAPAIADLQPQNLFWDPDNKHLYLIDLEAMHNMPPSYDFAKFASSIYIVCGQTKVALEWIQYHINNIIIESSTRRISLTVQLNNMLLWTGVEFYVYFIRVGDQKRQQLALDFLQWGLSDFIKMANNTV